MCTRHCCRVIETIVFQKGAPDANRSVVSNRHIFWLEAIRVCYNFLFVLMVVCVKWALLCTNNDCLAPRTAHMAAELPRSTLGCCTQQEVLLPRSRPRNRHTSIYSPLVVSLQQCWCHVSSRLVLFDFVPRFFFFFYLVFVEFFSWCRQTRAEKVSLIRSITDSLKFFL